MNEKYFNQHSDRNPPETLHTEATPSSRVTTT